MSDRQLPSDPAEMAAFLRGRAAAGNAPGYDIEIYARPDMWLRVAHYMDAQASRITDLETALLAATDLAKRQCERIEELEAAAAARAQDIVTLGLIIGRLEAERDARPVVRWKEYANHSPLYIGSMCIGVLYKDELGWYWESTENGRHPTPEAAKGAVEEALRGLSAKTEGA